jgi:hypothetical protein
MSSRRILISEVLPLRSGCHLLGNPLHLWEEAGDLGYALGRRGVTVKRSICS